MESIEDDGTNETIGNLTRSGDQERNLSIRIATKPVREHYQMIQEVWGKRATKERLSRAEAQMWQTLYHEFGHVLHKYAKLPMAVLAEWDRARASEPVSAAAEYTQTYYEREDPKRYREDFAETFAQIIEMADDPKAVLTTERQKAMYKIVKALDENFPEIPVADAQENTANHKRLHIAKYVGRLLGIKRRRTGG